MYKAAGQQLLINETNSARASAAESAIPVEAPTSSLRCLSSQRHPHCPGHAARSTHTELYALVCLIA